MMNVNTYVKSKLPELVQLRRHIHTLAELAFEESATAQYIINYLEKLPNPPVIVPGIGGTGFLAIFNYDRPDLNTSCGPQKTVVFRTELDAVPVHEINEFEHKSTNVGNSHKCGHDGHMAIVMGMALVLSEFYRPSSGRVVLLFQPAEEIGAGAQKMVDSGSEVLDDILKSPHTSIYALHNVPGFPAGNIVLPRGESFASASKGLHVKLQGHHCHASQPHLGHNPAPAMCAIVMGLLAMPTLHIPYDQKGMVTIVGARVGEKAFGVSAGDAEVMATLRATTDKTIKILEDKAAALVKGIAATYGLHYSTTYEDAFAATVNHPECVNIVTSVTSQLGLNLQYMGEAFPWSEDFGIFLQKTKGAMFGLGMGEDHEPLHGESYDFDDKQITTGVTMFASILQRTFEEEHLHCGGTPA